jgi:Cu-Zn family superoxide dismutase
MAALTPLIPTGASLAGIAFASCSLLMAAPAATAQFITQDATPAPIEAVLRDVTGKEVGVAVFAETGDGLVTIYGGVSGLTPGEHGIHVHETGVCDAGGAEPFSSAGAHYNPAGVKHGGPALTTEAAGTPAIAAATPMPMTGHAGDFGNIVADAGGLSVFELSTDRFGLVELVDADGSALIIHEKEDDLVTDPSGDSGGRVACGVIAAPAAGTLPPATPTS